MIQFTEENMGENYCDLELGKDFLDSTLEVLNLKEKNGKWTSSKLKLLALQKMLLID